MSDIMRYFKYDHLREGDLRNVSKLFCDLAATIDVMLPNGAEKATALRKLLEGKDAAVRAALDGNVQPVPVRNVLHITLGGADWEPTKEDIQIVTDLFQKATTDSHDPIVVTRTGVQCSVINRAELDTIAITTVHLTQDQALEIKEADRLYDDKAPSVTFNSNNAGDNGNGSDQEASASEVGNIEAGEKDSCQKEETHPRDSEEDHEDRDSEERDEDAGRPA